MKWWWIKFVCGITSTECDIKLNRVHFQKNSVNDTLGNRKTIRFRMIKFSFKTYFKWSGSNANCWHCVMLIIQSNRDTLSGRAKEPLPKTLFSKRVSTRKLHLSPFHLHGMKIVKTSTPQSQRGSISLEIKERICFFLQCRLSLT